MPPIAKSKVTQTSRNQLYDIQGAADYLTRYINENEITEEMKWRINIAHEMLYEVHRLARPNG